MMQHPIDSEHLSVGVTLAVAIAALLAGGIGLAVAVAELFI